MSNVIKFQAPFERLKLYNISPYISLFKAIITQAIIDATNVCETKEAKKIETEAKKWIFYNNEDFKEICLWAGVEPSIIIKITNELIKIHRSQTLLKANCKLTKRSKKSGHIGAKTNKNKILEL